MSDYTALHGILAPGTSVFGYHRGAPISAQVVEEWGLTVGEVNDPDADVVAGDLPADAPAGRIVPRPDAGANRARWEGYAIANGMPAAEAMVASQEDLETVVTTPQGDQPERPADSAPKADWVAYAIERGADEQWARDSATTKANLQAYEPQVGDTIAVAATEMSQG